MHPIAPIALEVIVLLLGIFLLLAESFSKDRDKSWMVNLAIFTLAWVGIFSFFTSGQPPGVHESGFWSYYNAGPVSLFFKRIAILTTVVVLVMAREYRGTLARYIPTARPGAGEGEFYALPVFTCAGLMFMASAVDLILIFVSLELVTVSFYVVVPYMRRKSTSLEAGVKYLILSALSTGFLVYGITWIFGVTGETNLAMIEAKLPSIEGSQGALLFGLVLVLVGLGFKVAAAPFQLWVPDVYQGAPTPVTAFLSVGSKAAGFLILMRMLQPFFVVPQIAEKVIPVLAILAGLSLLYGNLAAMPQDNMKRLLAYSSIAHAGYLLMAVASVGSVIVGFGSSYIAVGYYLAGYLLMTLLAFLVMIIVENHSRGDDIIHFNGLGKRSPFLAAAMLTAMLSLAGVPFTVGFYGKLLVFAAALSQSHYVLLGIGVLTVGAGFYYYIRVVAAMYWQEPNDDTPIRICASTRIVITALIVAIFFFGIFPQPILNMLRFTPGAPSHQVVLLP